MKTRMMPVSYPAKRLEECEMPLTEKQSESLARQLIDRGWAREGAHLVAPGGGIYFLESSPWVGDIDDFLERMDARLKRIESNRHMYDSDLDSFRRVREDTKTIVAVLKAIKTNALE